jgi:hypothetical protein
MKTHTGCKRQFVHGAEAWYAGTSIGSDRVDYVCIGMYHPDGGSTGEFMVTWLKLGDKVVPRLEVFDDAWSALWKFADVLQVMAGLDNESITPNDFCLMLLGQGIEDATPRRDPAVPTRKRSEAEALLAECLHTLDVWKDVAPSVSLRHDIQKFLNR